jgi:hypothetical protein
MAEPDKKEIADNAKFIVENPAFQHAILKLRKQWFGELMQLEPQAGSVGYLTRMARYVSLLAALEAVPTELAAIISNYQFDKKNK